MNQSIGANSFEKSLLEKCTDGWQQESANELWKETDLLVDEQNNLLEDKPIEDIFNHNVAFGDIGTSFEDIEIYEDILNASAMMDNDDCIYNQNFDIMKTNQFLQSDTFNDFLTLPLPDSMQRVQGKNKNQGLNTASIFDRGPIFGDDEIDQYMAAKNFNFHEPFGIANKSTREDDSVDPLQFWHKLNCGKLPDLDPSKTPSTAPVELDDSDESKKSTKSVLAIFDFTLPSLSSSASSCALSSPEQKDIEVESKSLESLQTPESSSNNGLAARSQPGLPVLIVEPDGDAGSTKTEAKKKKKKSRRNKNTLELLQQNLVLSSSSESSLVSVSDIKPSKKRKLNSAPILNPKSSSLRQTKHPETKPSSKTKSTPSAPKPTSPTLKAGAIYIEKQLSDPRIRTSHQKTSKPELNRTPVTPRKNIAKEITPKTIETSSKPKPKGSSKPNTSTPRSDKSQSKSEKRQRSSLPSPASMPQLTSESPPSILLARIKKDENNNKIKPSQGCPLDAKPAKMKNKSKNRK